MAASLFHVPASLGYGLLFLLVGVESAGVPVPGETALLAAAVLAAQGRLSIVLVIVTAAVAAIVGDNVGYLIGRSGGRWLLARPGRFQRGRARVLEEGEAFFARNGGRAVFLGRWVTGARVVVAWLAGAERMPWPRFALWNALGGITWAASIGLLAYWIGSTSSSILGALGFVGLAVALAAAVAYVVTRRRARRRRREPTHRPDRSAGGP
jgi:membrane-associated protein